MSKAHLLNLKTLKIQRVGLRCIGMLIERHYGIQETLGQWDPSNPNGTSVLYESSWGPLGPLSFFFSDHYNDGRYVKDIVLGCTDLPLDGLSYTYAEFDKVRYCGP